MAKEELLWITVDNFSPGIVSNLRRARGKYVPTNNPGAANVKNTYRCIALPGGGLGPLPRRTYEYKRGSTPDNPANLQSNRQFVISGFYVTGPLNVGAGSQRGHEFFFGIEYLYNNAGTPERRFRFERYPVFAASPTLEENLISWDTSTSFPSLNQYVTVKFATTISNSWWPPEAGNPVVVMSHYAPGPLNPSRTMTFPDQDAMDQSTMGSVFEDEYFPSYLLAHQGRIVFCHQRNTHHGAVSEGQWLNNEFIYFTQPNDVLNLANEDPYMFSPENPAGYGTGMSLSANDLLLIKKRYGGVLVRGNLEDPVVIALPNIASADRGVGANSRIGYLYPGDDGGAHLFSGGDGSQHVSMQLQDYFWLPDDDPNIFLDNRVWWANWGSNYIVTSNLYMLDVEDMGWWRLDDPEDLRQGIWNIQMGNSRYLYGATYSFTSGSDTLVYGWDQRSLARDWSWEGHPIRPFEGDREFEIRQVLITGQGHGEITWTPILQDGSYGAPITVDFSSDAPVMHRVNAAVHQTFLHYRVQAEGDDGEAPILHSIKFGLDMRNQIPVTEYFE